MVSTGDVGDSSEASLEVATLDPEVVARRTRELLDHGSWSREQLLSFQKDRLKESLQHAVNASSFYRERIGELVARDAPLETFPVMNKTILMAEFDRIVTDPCLSRAMVEEHVSSNRAGLLLLDEYRVAATGGSSGQRGLFVYDKIAWEIIIANIRRLPRTSRLASGCKGSRYWRAIACSSQLSVLCRAARWPLRRTSIISHDTHR